METTRRGFFGLVAGAAAAAVLPRAAPTLILPPGFTPDLAQRIVESGHVEFGYGFSITQTAIEDDLIPPDMARWVGRDWWQDPATETYHYRKP